MKKTVSIVVCVIYSKRCLRMFEIEIKKWIFDLLGTRPCTFMFCSYWTKGDLIMDEYRFATLHENMQKFHASFVCFVVVCKSLFSYLATTISSISLYNLLTFLSSSCTFLFLYLYLREVMVPKDQLWYHGTKKEKKRI